MKLNKAETAAVILAMVAAAACIIIFFLRSDMLWSGKGSSSEPLPEYVANENKVNINAATVEELTAIEGISRKAAEDIAVYRNITPITELEQLLDIEGIDESTLELIKDKITFVN